MKTQTTSAALRIGKKRERMCKKLTNQQQRRKRIYLHRILIFLSVFAVLCFLLGFWIGRSTYSVAASSVILPPIETTLPTIDTNKANTLPLDKPANSIPLDPEIQDHMKATCEKYDVPYALVLAIADVESDFNPNAKSNTNDYGLMQINIVNHKWLCEIGMDPLTNNGNIEAGIHIIADKLKRYGNIDLALMAYNCGDSGAKKLWDKGTYRTEYSQKVMTAYILWQTKISK